MLERFYGLKAVFLYFVAVTVKEKGCEEQSGNLGAYSLGILSLMTLIERILISPLLFLGKEEAS